MSWAEAIIWVPTLVPPSVVFAEKDVAPSSGGVTVIVPLTEVLVVVGRGAAAGIGTDAAVVDDNKILVLFTSISLGIGDK